MVGEEAEAHRETAVLVAWHVGAPGQLGPLPASGGHDGQGITGQVAIVPLPLVFLQPGPVHPWAGACCQAKAKALRADRSSVRPASLLHSATVCQLGRQQGPVHTMSLCVCRSLRSLWPEHICSEKEGGA